MMRKTKTNPYRLLTQVTILAIIIFALARTFADNQYTANFEGYCPFGGIQAYASFLVNNSLACNMTNIQISMGLVLVICVVLFSKLFCSLICPVGTVSEWLGNIGERWKVRRDIAGIGDKILRSFKYILLFITSYISVTSSELFCKWFCPYFSVTSAFSPDVNIILAIAALVAVIAGSVFYRLFWCRYLCPVNAISNIFHFIYPFAGITVTYFIVRAFGIDLPFTWPLAILCISAYVFELMGQKWKSHRLFRIVRNKESCTACNLCTKSCPMGIRVVRMDKVSDPDCHLCGDCLHTCPEKDTLTINRSGKKWLPLLVVIILVTAGLLFSRSFELPTVFEQWADKEEMQEMETYNITGIKTITCYGSSIVFAGHMYDMEGIYGVATYLKDNSARIWYDPEFADTSGIREWIFSPAAIPIAPLPDTATQVAFYTLRVDNFLDSLDNELLAGLLSSESGIYGITSEFACPVKVSVYYSEKSDLTTEKLKTIIEQRDVANIRRIKGGVKKLNYKVTEIDNKPIIISRPEYFQIMELKDSLVLK